MNKNLIILSISIFSILPAIAMENQKIGAHLPVYNIALALAKQELERNHLALHRACENGNLASAKLLIQAGANVHAKKGYRWVAIHCAAWRGQ